MKNWIDTNIDNRKDYKYNIIIVKKYIEYSYEY